MFDRWRYVALVAVSLIATASNPQTSADLPREKYDVVIISGSSSGIGAAIGAARLGVKVALVEDTPVLGGMLSNGVGNVDSMSIESTSGVFREFTDHVKAYYEPIITTDPLFQKQGRRSQLSEDGKQQSLPTAPKVGVTTVHSISANEAGRWEPHVADLVFKEMASHYPNLRIFYMRHAESVIVKDGKLIGVVTYENSQPNAYSAPKPGSGLVLYGDAIVDATHEGDIAAWAGVPFNVGREARTRLEPHAGSIYFFDRTGEILPGSDGRQDSAMVSYGERITIQQFDDAHYVGHLINSPPPGYDKSNYEHSPYVPKFDNPNLKAEVNQYPFGNEIEQLNWKWSQASRKERERLYQKYKEHAIGFLYYLQHEKGQSHWGLPDDDYLDNGHVPYRIYVREARRMVGESTMSESDINPFLVGTSLIQPIRKDSVAVGHYAIDCKPSYTKVNLSTPDRGNGDFFLTNVVEPFQIPYSAMLPKEINGVVFPTAMSASHVAFCGIRLDPIWTVTGQAAGIAAALSSKEHVELRAVPVVEIQRELLKQKAELMFYWDLPLDHPAFSAIQWLSVRDVVTGYPDRTFRPDQPLTRAELAKLLVLGLDVWPSVSNMHFSDVPQDNWSFRFIETLYDNCALGPLGVDPLWPQYGAWDNLGKAGVGYLEERGLSAFYPEKAVTWKEAIDVIKALQAYRLKTQDIEGDAFPRGSISDPATWSKSVLSNSMFGRSYAEHGFDIRQSITRGQAAALIAALIDGGGN